MDSLNVMINGIKLKNPLIAASGVVGYGEEIEKFLPISKFGAFAVKGTTKQKREGNASPRIAETPAGMLNSIGLENPGIDYFIEKILPSLTLKGTEIIANISGSSYEEYEYLTERLDETNVNLIELNVSCPNVKEGGLMFGSDVKTIAKVVSLARKKTNKTLIAKLSPNVGSIVEIAKSAEAAGADALTLINTLHGMKIDIKTRRPILKNNFGGLSGACLLPVATYLIWKTKKEVKIPIVGCGGIMSYEDALELIIAGASLFQIGTAILKDPTVVLKILKDLKNWLKNNKIRNISELVGSLKEW